MKKNLLSLFCIAVICFFSNKAGATAVYAPYFNDGPLQFLSVCQNSLPTDISLMLIATDSSVGDAETWSVLLAPTHGSLIAGYTTTSTGGLLTPTGLSYTPTTGYYGADSFSVVISDGTQTDTTFFAVIVNNIPFGVTITGPSLVCIGTPVTLSSLATTGTWSASNVDASVMGGIVTGATPGTDTIRYIAFNSCGSDTAYHIVTVSAMPNAGAISGVSAVCLLSSVTLSTTGTGGTWMAANGNATLAGSVVTGAAGGADTIFYIASNSCGADTAMHIITVDTALAYISAITGPDHVCLGNSISLSDSVSGGTWTSLHTAIATISGSGVVFGAAVGTDTLVYSITNGCGTASRDRYFHVQALPNAGVITGFDSVCQGMTIVLSSTGTPGGTWSSTSATNAGVNSGGVVSGALHGSAIIIYTVTNLCGTDTANHPVNVNVPAGAILGATTLCTLTPTIYIDPTPGGNWSSSSLIVLAIFGGNAIGLTIGTATITYTLNNACGTTTSTLDVEVINCASGINEVNGDAASLNLSPNPNTGTFTLTVPSASAQQVLVVVTNMLGQEVKKFTMRTNAGNEVSLDAPAGVYLISTNVDGRLLTTRMIITQ